MPLEISRPIRAGILLGVAREPLFELVVDLMKAHPISYPNQGGFHELNDGHGGLGMYQ